MPEEQQPEPDHTLESAEIPEDTEGPEIYAVSDLRAYAKPDLDEELSNPVGGGAADCGAEVICTCVPVETCACNVVTRATGGGSCPGDCSCVGNTCVSLYWYPN